MNDLSHPLSLAEYRYVLKYDLTSFIHAAFLELNPQTPYIAGSHIELLASKLEACRRGEITRLIINLPPRNLKSHAISISFAAWLLGHAPSKRIICVSYAQELSDKLARDTRLLMQSPWYKSLFDTRIADRQAVHDFETTAMGGRLATSVGGTLTGRGGDFLILDDPLKPDAAYSEAMRNGANEWFENTLLSRLNDKAKGCIIIVMQRLHQDDLVGYVQDLDDWEILSLPALALAPDEHLITTPFGTKIWGRNEGDALHPERENCDVLQRIRRQIGEANFSSQYLQNPLPPGGAIVKHDWLKYYVVGTEPARFGRIVQSWDTANKAGELNDYSVCTTWGINSDGIYLLNVFRKRLNFPELKRAVIDLKSRFRPTTILIEDKASGTQLIQELKDKGIRITAYAPPPRTDKEMRLHAQTSAFESGQIFLPKDAPWLADYVAEITGFPNTKFDDQVDSTTQFLDHIGSKRQMIKITDEILRRASIPGPYTFRGTGFNNLGVPISY